MEIRFQSKRLSPIEQHYTPAIHNKQEILWIPGAFHQKLSGTTLMTYRNTGIKALQKRRHQVGL